jgi:hypothetical protein
MNPQASADVNVNILKAKQDIYDLILKLEKRSRPLEILGSDEKESNGIMGGFLRILPHSRTALSYILKCFAVKQYDFSKLLKQLGNSFLLSG